MSVRTVPGEVGWNEDLGGGLLDDQEAHEEAEPETQQESTELLPWSGYFAQ